MNYTTQNYETLLCAVENSIATVTLNRPDVLHALNAAMFDDLERVFEALCEDENVRVILLTGAGDRAFAAGADIRGLSQTDAQSGRAVSNRGQQVFRQIELCRKPVIACVNGVALGGGCELAMACTLRIASETAKMGMPEVKLGLIPGYGGTQRLVRLVGRGAALRMMLTASVVGAEEALRLGLVQQVAPAAELMAQARAMAAAIAAMAPLAVEGVLEAVEHGTSIESGLLSEAHIFGRLCGTADKHEGVAAFLEKRKPVWTGK
ncbi:MAG: enoyl-CoA hydratase-related protein [Acidobacteriaceae bacterium]